MDLIDNPQIDQILNFIHQHEQDDPAHLLLSKIIPESFPKQEIAEQIAARKKAKLKLPSLYLNKSVIFPPSISMEQCSSEATALFKSTIMQGNSLADLTGGFGIDTLYLSKKFQQVDYVEQQSQLCKIAEHNFKELSANHIKVHHTDSLLFIEQLHQVDCVYIDPARRDKNNQKVFGWQDCQPDLTASLPTILSKAQTVLAKAAPMLDITQAIRELNEKVQQVYIIEWRGEVRELLFLIGHKAEENAKIKVCILNDAGEIAQHFSSSFEAEKNTPLAISLPKKYLYEPAAAIMKSGLFKTLGQQFQLDKLHSNTNLFTADEIKTGFPGKIYQINAAVSAQKKMLKPYLPALKGNLKCRNFPMAIADLKRKLSLKDGGDNYLFATTLSDNTKSILICQKVD